MKKSKTILSLVAVAMLGLSGCEGIDDAKSSLDKEVGSQKDGKDVVQRTGDEDKDNNYQELASKAVFNKTYKATVNSSDPIDWYIVEDAKVGSEYYLHLINLGDSNANPETNKIMFKVYDDEGKMMSKSLSIKTAETTYKIVPEHEGKIYIKFYSNSFGSVHTNSRFQFDIKTGLSEGLKQDESTYEYNDFINVSYPIATNTIYKSSATGTKDSSDWYVLENIKSDREYYFHLKNLGDKNSNPEYTKVRFSIYDEEGKIKSSGLSTRTAEYTYSFSPITDGKVYIYFNTHMMGSVYGHMRYEFEVK